MNLSEQGQTYFQQAIKQKFSNVRLNEVVESINLNGFWEEEEEWRMGTYMTSRIEKTEDRYGKTWYKATVENGGHFTCDCPTINRAVQYLGVLEQSSKDMFKGIGWPSWAEKGRLNPSAGEI